MAQNIVVLTNAPDSRCHTSAQTPYPMIAVVSPIQPEITIAGVEIQNSFLNSKFLINIAEWTWPNAETIRLIETTRTISVSLGSLKNDAINGAEKNKPVVTAIAIATLITNTVDMSSRLTRSVWMSAVGKPPVTTRADSTRKIVVKANKPDSAGPMIRARKIWITSCNPWLRIWSIIDQRSVFSVFLVRLKVWMFSVLRQIGVDLEDDWDQR